MNVNTSRLVLRSWREEDRESFAQMSQDAEVMRYLLPLATRGESDAWIDRQAAHEAAHGICFWAVADRETGAFLGTVGLSHIRYEAHFTPAVEVGWRLARPAWGRGLAPEAAAACLELGFATLGFGQIVANTATGNTASQRVMQKLGMTRDPADDYDHPRVPEGNPLKRQVLYRITRAAWEARA